MSNQPEKEEVPTPLTDAISYWGGHNNLLCSYEGAQGIERKLIAARAKITLWKNLLFDYQSGGHDEEDISCALKDFQEATKLVDSEFEGMDDLTEVVGLLLDQRNKAQANQKYGWEIAREAHIVCEKEHKELLQLKARVAELEESLEEWKQAVLHGLRNERQLLSQNQRYSDKLKSINNLTHPFRHSNEIYKSIYEGTRKALSTPPATQDEGKEDHE